MSEQVSDRSSRGTPSSERARPRGGAAACVWLAALGVAVPVARAQFASDFEPPFIGSAAGTSINGQQNWFTPLVAGSIDGLVVTYAGNAFGLPANSDGGDQLLVTRSGGGTSFARAQREGLSLPNVTEICYDLAANFDGVAPTAQNLSSFSLQPEPNSAAPSLKSYIQLNTWVDVSNPTAWSISFLPYSDLNVQFAQPGSFPGPEWQNLPLNRWYRLCTTVDFDQNRITSVSLTDLESGVATTAEPVGWYLGGGAASALGIPTGCRFFGGGGLGNITGWDNLTMDAAGNGCPACPADYNQDGGIDGTDVEAFFIDWQASEGCSDTNQDGGVDGADVETFFTAWEGGGC